MHGLIKHFSRRFVGKNDRAQRSPVNQPGAAFIWLAQNFRPKVTHQNFLHRSLIEKGMADGIRINHRSTKLSQLSGERTFAGSDTSNQTENADSSRLGSIPLSAPGRRRRTSLTRRPATRARPLILFFPPTIHGSGTFVKTSATLT
jgi:hypothetical protein